MPRLFGRLWRSGGRRAEVAEAGFADGQTAAGGGEAPEQREDIGRRLEEARQRLRQTIPPPEDPEPPQR